MLSEALLSITMPSGCAENFCITGSKKCPVVEVFSKARCLCGVSTPVREAHGVEGLASLWLLQALEESSGSGQKIGPNLQKTALLSSPSQAGM